MAPTWILAGRPKSQVCFCCGGQGNGNGREGETGSTTEEPHTTESRQTVTDEIDEWMVVTDILVHNHSVFFAHRVNPIVAFADTVNGVLETWRTRRA